jgi:hypothetical protein
MRLPMIAAAASFCLTAVPARAGDDLDRLIAERQALKTADQACRVLAPGARAALEAGLNQALAAGRRAGRTDEALGRVLAQGAEAGERLSCEAPALAVAAHQAEQGFAAWSRRHEMAFPGAFAAWRVRRTPDPQGWFLWQDVAGGDARFGLRRDEAGARLVFSAAALPEAPASARLLVRDPQRSADPPAALALGRRPSALAAVAPRPGAAAIYMASARVVSSAAAVAFEFETAALAALAALDSREAAVLEFIPRRAGATPQRLYVEAGDLAAAIAFLKAAPD